MPRNVRPAERSRQLQAPLCSNHAPEAKSARVGLTSSHKTHPEPVVVTYKTVVANMVQPTTRRISMSPRACAMAYSIPGSGLRIQNSVSVLRQEIATAQCSWHHQRGLRAQQAPSISASKTRKSIPCRQGNGARPGEANAGGPAATPARVPREFLNHRSKQER
jgi:hypothetical protein